MSKCYRCGKELTTGDGSNIECSQCQANKPLLQGGMQGWICPVCGAGNSPYTSRCSCMGYPPMKVTC